MTYQYGWFDGQAARKNTQTGDVHVFNRPVCYRGTMESCWRTVVTKSKSRFTPW